MKKAISLLAALACISAFSCSSKTVESELSSQVITAGALSLKSAAITLGNELETVAVIDKTGVNVLVFGEDDRGGYTGFVTDCTFADQRSFRVIPAEGERVMTACMCKFQKTAVLTVTDGNMLLYIYNKDGELFKTLNLGRSVIPDDVTPILCAGDEDFIISINNDHFMVYSAEGDAMGEIDLGGSTVYGFSKDSDGIPTLLLRDSGGTSAAQITGTELTNITPCNELASSAYAICGGNEEYSLFARFTEGLFGLKEGQWVKLSDLSDCGIMASDIWGLLNLGGNDFAALTIAAGRTGLYMLSERNISEVSTKKTVKYAMLYHDDVMRRIINNYNNGSENFRAEVVEYYSDTAYDRDEMMTRLRLDIIGGDPPDVVGGYIPEINTANYMDIFELIDNDPELSRDDFVPNILDAMAINGRLAVLAPDFSISTMMIKSKFEGVRENWSFDDLITVYRNMPEGMEFKSRLSRHYMLDNFMAFIPLREFVDYENGQCDFRSPEFIKLLNFFRDEPVGITEDEYDIGDDAYYTGNDIFDFNEDKLLVGKDRIPTIRYIWWSSRSVDDEFIMAGMPTVSGKGSAAVPADYQFSIPLNARDPEGAWDLLKYYIIDYYGGHGMSYSSMPIYKPSFDRNRLKCLVNEPGNEELVYFGDGQDVTEVRYKNREMTEYEIISPLTEEELEKYTEFVYEAAKNFYREDDTLAYTIVKDELQAFFAGEITAEQAAEHIQNRASIYLSERY